jgi:AMMECR1 domain-containing protein
MYSVIVCRYLDSLTASELGGVDGDQLRGSIGTPHPKPYTNMNVKSGHTNV